MKVKQRTLLEINDIKIESGNRYVIIGPSTHNMNQAKRIGQYGLFIAMDY
ncbi:hypothetical protein J7E81_26030 [Bacillus sp. ISL-18]|nr:hypothetical protein [Bacillus sp. ISL-18]MBT2658636.1 hypothetical protein [Bacillus sp. ISL-18]